MKHKVLGGKRSEDYVLLLNRGVQAVPEGSQTHMFMFAGDGETPEDRNISYMVWTGCWAQNKLHRNPWSWISLEDKL